jgi:hypothetical protein
MRATSLLAAGLCAASLLAARPASAAAPGCGGQAPADAAPEFCKVLSLRPLDRDEAARAAHAACLAYFTRVAEGVDLLCAYRDGLLAVDSTPEKHREQIGVFGRHIQALDAAFTPYAAALAELVERGKTVRRQEHTCRASASQAASTEMLIAGTYSTERAYVSRNLLGDRLSLWRSHAERVAGMRSPGGVIRADPAAAARVFTGDPTRAAGEGAIPQEPDGNPQPGTRQLHQALAIGLSNRLNLLHTTTAFLGVAFNLNARRDLRGTPDWGDYVSVLAPAGLGLAVGAVTRDPRTGSLVGLGAGAVADYTERRLRGQDVVTQIIRDYPPYAFDFVRRHPDSSAYQVSVAFHQAHRTGLCELSHPAGP